MPFLLAGLSSLTFGIADFLGGVATRRAPVVSIVVTSQLVGGAGILVVAWILPEAPASAADFGWGAAAGGCGAIGIMLLYQALATTRVAVAAPVGSLVGTAVPVVFGIAVGERPASLAWVGVVLGLIAVVLMSRSPQDRTGSRSGAARAVVLGSAAGIAFGLFGVFISRTGTDAGLWPLVGARTASLALVGTVAITIRRPLIARDAMGPAAAAGALDMTANVLFLVAVRQELLSLVSVIMAMYPVSTVGLARIVFREEITRTQVAGMILGVVAVALIVAS